MSFRNDRARRAAGCLAVVVLLALLAVAGGCDSEPVREATGGAVEGLAVALDLSVLADCPADDRVWAELVRQAKSDVAALARLRDGSLDVAKRHPARWQPLWTAAESEFWRARSAGEEHERDRELCERAAGVARSAGDPVGVARATNRLGWIALESGDAARSRELFDEALAAGREAGRDDILAYVHNALARVQALSGELSEAVDSLGEATRLLERIDSPDAAWVAHNRAHLLRDLGRIAEALELLQRLHERAEAEGDSRLANHARQAIAQVHLALGELDLAQEWFTRIDSSEEQLAASAALGLGRVAFRRGELDQALERFDGAAAQRASRQVALLARVDRGEALFRSGRVEQARAELEPLVAELEGAGYPEAAHYALTVLAKTHLLDAAGAAGAARAVPLLERAVEIIEAQGETLDPGGEGLTYLRGRADAFADLAAALTLMAAEPAQTYRIVERAHARSLRRLLPGSSSIGVTDARTVQRSLSAGELVLDYLVGRDRSVLVALGPDRVAAHVLPGIDRLGPEIARWRRALVRPLTAAEARLDPRTDLLRDVEAGRLLERELFGPVAAELARARRVWIVPDQELALLPFHALPCPGQGRDGWPVFCGERHEFGVLPMAGRVPGASGARRPLLLAGDPLAAPGGEFGALAQAGDELERIERVWEGDGTTLRGRELTRRGLLERDLERFGTIHLATHAVASSVDPRRCAVMLSNGESWGLQEIAATRLGPSLVVLSACRTGEGEIVPGEGVVGLAWAFLRAGAQGVTASLWSVEDASTADLMHAFHSELRAGRDPVAALDAARGRVQETRPHPVYWAPFVVVMRPADAAAQPSSASSTRARSPHAPPVSAARPSASRPSSTSPAPSAASPR